MRLTRLLLISFVAITLSGCLRPYKIAIQQGNIINAKQVKQMHVGMSRYQVVKLLGEPLLNNIYRTNQLIYVYSFQPAYRRMQRKHLWVYFSGNRVTRFNYSH